MKIKTPEWVKQAVFYQIFPDRFARSPRNRLPKGIQFKPWGSPPEEQGFQGGDLYGVADRLDYLKDLGINAIYLNPIFSAAANHRYNAYDYMEVDPLLGGDTALRVLLDEAHQRGIRIVLDGVFNHCGRGFWPFHHLLENGSLSPYADWFIVHGYPLHAYPEAGSRTAKTAPNYSSWWGIRDLPKLNTNNPGVREYLFNVARHWLEFGIDGWRLDVPEEINDDSFWREFRQVVKGANPEAYIVGEIWHPAQRHLQGDMFDAVMNYIITQPVLSFFGGERLNTTWKHAELNLRRMDAQEFGREIEAMWRLYDWQIHFAQLNMLDSHDMPRALWLLGEDKAALRLAVLCQMTMPGAPCVYYGDEIGLSGGGDPYCRAAFPWQKETGWDKDLLAFYRSVIALRMAYPALQTGNYALLQAEGNTLAYSRSLGGQSLIAAFNAGGTPVQFSISAGALRGFSAQDFRVAWPEVTQARLQVREGGLYLELPAQSGLVLAAGAP